jgi:hypothetical protein
MTMPSLNGKRTIAIVTACIKANNAPALALTEVAVTPREIDLGIHFYLAEADLLEGGYLEPFVHFDEDEAPGFLHPAVRQHLGLSPLVSNPTTHALVEVH